MKFDEGIVPTIFSFLEIAVFILSPKSFEIPPTGIVKSGFVISIDPAKSPTVLLITIIPAGLYVLILSTFTPKEHEPLFTKANFPFS